MPILVWLRVVRTVWGTTPRGLHREQKRSRDTRWHLRIQTLTGSSPLLGSWIEHRIGLCKLRTHWRKPWWPWPRIKQLQKYAFWWIFLFFPSGFRVKNWKLQQTCQNKCKHSSVCLVEPCFPHFPRCSNQMFQLVASFHKQGPEQASLLPSFCPIFHGEKITTSGLIEFLPHLSLRMGRTFLWLLPETPRAWSNGHFFGFLPFVKFGPNK